MEQTAPEGVTSDLLEADDLSQVVEAREAKPDVKPDAEEHKTPDPEKQKEIDRNLNMALKEERRLRREQENRLQLQEQRLALLEERRLAAQQPQKPEIPDYDIDPLAHVKAKADELAAQNQALLQAEHNRRAQAQQQHVESQIVGWYQGQAAEFAKEAPDFNDAYEFVRTRRATELQAMGLSQQEILATLRGDEMWIVQTAGQRGQNPAEVIYNIAKSTGYAKKAPEAEQKMTTMQKGLAATKTLGSGGASNGKITLEQLAAMSQDDFDAYCNNNGGMEKVMSQAR